MSTYTILAAPVESTTEEKNSDFLTFLHPVTSREEAVAYVDFYQKKYHAANHVCWAYIIGDTRQPKTQAFNDDGEPSGTAGKPMLHVLTERDVGNSLAVVVRYFGGVKLGAGGLVRAYSGAVSKAVNRAQLVQVIPSASIQVAVDFAKETNIRHILHLFQGHVVDVEYATRVTMAISLAATQAELFIQQVMNETAGDAAIQINN